ncbi:ABC transporter permease [Desulfosporosinus sp. BICA1-9]|uniref:ABC transporter permease n=1 Tax=Desulfosporosinus sp. BICA1-9 TaxID=1531958 RepID=UPI00054BEFAE|nr:ABC transporter permease [Desulfosporosinus sp. BICA1-9]KJS83267.1 MAG: ABC transporter permease [Desulfosporosinus sp. BICA1-9]HBW35721.1 ABC transporter permease [Desulfosporosinus sp.]
MFWRMLKKSFSKGLKGKLLAVVTIAFGASLASSMLNISLDIGDKVNRELKTYGANILVEPRVETVPVNIGGIEYNPLQGQSFLEDASLSSLKTIFWANNILSFTPYLEQPAVTGKQDTVLVGTWFNKEITTPAGEKVVTGAVSLKAWWKVNGQWADDSSENQAMVGTELAQKAGIKQGDNLKVLVNTPSGGKEQVLKVTGVFDSGSGDDRKVFVPLALIQKLQGTSGKVSKVEVSALTTPENELARRAAKDLQSLTSEEYERWYCTAYVGAITYQIEEILPGVRANAIRQVAESEGLILGKIQLLMLLLTAAALLSAALGISSLMTTKVLERSKEIGLLKALGAEGWQVIALFVAESVISGILGGVLGYLMGLGFAQVIGQAVFGSGLSIKIMVLPIVLTLSVGVALLGSLSAIRMLVNLRPAEVLHGR